MYTINYDPTGNPISIIKEGKQIPLALGNMDFEEFLKWNEQRTRPLDWRSSIMVQAQPTKPTIEERIRAIEEKVLQVQEKVTSAENLAKLGK